MARAILFIATFFCFTITAHAQAPSKELATAVLKNNAAAAETLLAAGANPNAVVEIVPGFPTTYLITAAAGGHIELVKLLLKHKAQVNQPDGFKGTALMAAAGRGDKVLVELLLASGADARRRTRLAVSKKTSTEDWLRALSAASRRAVAASVVSGAANWIEAS